MSDYSQKLRTSVISCQSSTPVSQQLLTIILSAADKIDELEAKSAKPIAEHPDVQRLIIQVETLSQENKRLSKRDCNATVQILLPTADSPFNKEDCRIVDVGHSDNIYVVECDAVVELQAENKRLKGLLGMAVCPNCDGSGSIPHQVSSETRVSRDMALDAGMPELEGSIYTPDEWEAEQCRWCYERNEALKGQTDD